MVSSFAQLQVFVRELTADLGNVSMQVLYI